jgi:hypothetical protein
MPFLLLFKPLQVISGLAAIDALPELDCPALDLPIANSVVVVPE